MNKKTCNNAEFVPLSQSLYLQRRMQVQSLQEDPVLANNIDHKLYNIGLHTIRENFEWEIRNSDYQNIIQTQDTNNVGHSDYQTIKQTQNTNNVGHSDWP